MNEPFRDWASQGPLRLAVDEFFRLADAGAFERFTRTELIDGEVLTMNSQWLPHARAVTGLSFELMLAVEAIGLDYLVLGGPSVRIEPDSAPEPDLVLTSHRGKREVPADTVALAIEVSASTLSFDLGRKLQLYASAGIPEYWVVDMDGRCVRQFWTPVGENYQDYADLPFGQPITAATIAGFVIPTTRLA